jgi:hypothetical protein
MDETALAEKWQHSATQAVDDVDAALTDALALVDDRRVPYTDQPEATKRVINQAVFERLTIGIDGELNATPTPVYATLIPLKRALASTPAQSRAQKDPDPDFRGQGSHFAHMAEREGFEPSNEVDPRYAISSRARSTAPAPLQAVGRG